MMSELTIGQRLKIARKAAGLTQDELGEAIGVGKSQISNIEKGSSLLTKANAIVLSEKIGIELNWLLNGIGETPKPGQLYNGPINKAKATGNTVNIGGHSSAPVATNNLENEIAQKDLIISNLEYQLRTLEKLVANQERLIANYEKMLHAKEGN